MIAQAGGKSEGEQIVQAARTRPGIDRARDIFMADVARFFARQILFDRDGAEFFDQGHSQAASTVTDTQESILTSGKGNNGWEGGADDNQKPSGGRFGVPTMTTSRLYGLDGGTGSDWIVADYSGYSTATLPGPNGLTPDWVDHYSVQFPYDMRLHRCRSSALVRVAH